MGQYTMLFLTIVRRIHVRFVNDAPVFYIDPQGPLLLSKDTALSSVWAMTVLYGLFVGLVAYLRPRPNRAAWLVIGALALTFSVIAALAEPWWGLIVLADFAAICPWLTGRAAAGDAP